MCKKEGGITDHPVLIEDFDDDRWWEFLDVGDRSIDDDLIEDDHFVPGWTQGLVDDLGAETLVSKDDPSEWVRQTRIIRTNQSAGLIHVRTQLEDLLLCIDRGKKKKMATLM